VGEGAGILVVEERGHALRRGARIYGELVGYGASSDFNYDPRASEDSTGKRVAMMRALADASMAPEDVDFLLANGSGIPQDDLLEMDAIMKVFAHPSSNFWITAVKPITGHLVYGAGSIELTAAILALDQQVIPPIVNLDELNASCSLPFVKYKSQPCQARAFLFNAFGFGGQNASLVVKK
jgi:3-oxoacyl-[acyl-carrier-protein] synthase II